MSADTKLRFIEPGRLEQAFNVQVTPVNDAPSFSAGADVRVVEQTGEHRVEAWAKDLCAGPEDEHGQKLRFELTCDKPELFAVPPALTTEGLLSFTLASSGTGTATVTAQLKDDGGTVQGGVDTSAPQTFRILVRPTTPEPTRLAAPSFTPDGGFRLSVVAEPGGNVVIEVSSDLVDWSVLTTLTNPDGAVSYSDTNPPGMVRFYRVRTSP